MYCITVVNLIIHLVKWPVYDSRHQLLDSEILEGHLRARELSALSNNLLDGVKEVTFSSDLAPGAYGKHPSLNMMR